jgi:predicted nucleotidyltransferase
VELGRRAGVTQSVVSAYESGARQPSLPTLERLVRATGYKLDITVREPKPRARALDGPVGQKLLRHRRKVRDIIARHGLSNVRVFGSVARGEDAAESDLDLLVDVGPGVGLVGLARCERDLEALLGVPVDLVPADDLKPAVAVSALSEARPL